MNTKPSIVINLPHDFKDFLKAEAAKDRRSLNNYLITLLENATSYQPKNNAETYDKHTAFITKQLEDKNRELDELRATVEQLKLDANKSADTPDAAEYEDEDGLFDELDEICG